MLVWSASPAAWSWSIPSTTAKSKGKSMAEQSSIRLLDHELADDELQWVKGVYDDFVSARAAFVGRENECDPKEILRDVLGRTEHRLQTPMDLSGDGPWRNGRNNHERLVTCVFLKKIELHRHEKSRTDQFPMYVIGEADAFSVQVDGQPVLTAVTGGDHFHNSPDAPHAFLPKVGEKIPDDWEIAFIAITPRNLKDDTQKVPDEIGSLYTRVVGLEAPAGL
jgi:hypothetical protein